MTANGTKKPMKLYYDRYQYRQYTVIIYIWMQIDMCLLMSPVYVHACICLRRHVCADVVSVPNSVYV